jgi:hypothetical protein
VLSSVALHRVRAPEHTRKDSSLIPAFGSCCAFADIYINGAFVQHHEEGYTSFPVYLHNATAPLVWGGGPNVLAVYVDATQSELWCYEVGARDTFTGHCGQSQMSEMQFFTQQCRSASFCACYVSMQGGGIYRHVWLESAALLSVTPWGHFTRAYVPLNAIASPQGAYGPQTATSVTLTPQVRLL